MSEHQLPNADVRNEDRKVYDLAIKRLIRGGERVPLEVLEAEIAKKR